MTTSLTPPPPLAPPPPGAEGKLSIACLLAALFVVRAAPASAASITITDRVADLPETARETVGILMDAGIPARKVGDHRFVVEVHGFHCDLRSRDADDPDDPTAGVPTRKCRFGADSLQGTTAGKPFAEGRALLDILEEIAQKRKGLVFSDCGMGYCGAYAPTIRCTINTKIESYEHGGRWACTYTDEQ